MHDPQIQNHCLCDPSLIDDIKLDIEILHSKTDALQSLANVLEGCSPIIDNASKIQSLIQEFSEGKEKINRIEAELTDAKRFICKMRDTYRQSNPSFETKISTVVRSNNAKFAIHGVGDFGSLSTPASVQSSRSTHADAVNVPCSLTENNILTEHSNRTSPIDVDSYINESPPVAQTSFKAQLQDYYGKQRLLFESNCQTEAYPQNHLPIKEINNLPNFNSSIPVRITSRVNPRKNFHVRSNTRRNILPVQRYAPYKRTRTMLIFFRIPRPHRSPEWLDYLETVKRTMRS